jgi:hypothetical protein
VDQTRLVNTILLLSQQHNMKPRTASQTND